MSGEKLGKDRSDVKSKVMGEIRKKKIRMTCHAAILAKKLGLESAMLGSLIFGALLISVFFYFFKKTKLIKFVNLGVPGLKVLLTTIPYDYIVLFIVSIILAVYLANKLDLSYENKVSGNILAIFFLMASIILGVFFILAGFHETVKGWSKNKIPRDNAVWGKVLEISPKEVTIQDENGDLVRVELKRSVDMKKIGTNEKGRYMRAVGDRDKNDSSFFHAENVLCCDDD
jgi:hypothetical protein